VKRVLRRLRGALGNALVWGVGWFAAGFVLIAGLYLVDGGYWSIFLRDAIGFSSTLAGIGFVTGGAFSAYIAASFRDRRLEDLSPARFALGGGLVALLLTLLIGTGFAVLGAVGLPLLEALIFPLLTSTTLGAITGYSSLKLAQRALLEPGADRGALGSGVDRLAT
jgi:hypothetical protein